MSGTSRVKAALRTLVRGEARRRRGTPIPALSAQDLKDFHAFFPRPKFFIFGHARSGTTLLVRLLRLHPEVHCDYQAHFFTRRPMLKSLVDTPEAEEWLSRKSNRWNHGGDLSPVVLRAAAEFIMERDAARQGKRIVGDKSPSSTIHGQSVRDLHDLFPDARLVYIVRDGRDVAVSERFRNFVEDSRFLSPHDRRILDALKANPDEFGGAQRSIFTAAMLRRVAKGWATNLAEINEEGRRLFGRRYYVLRYEDMLAQPAREMKRLWEFLGVKRIPRSLERSIKSEMSSNPDREWQVRRDQQLSSFLAKGKAGNWHALFTNDDRAVFKAATGETLQRWKYERSQDW